MKLEEMIDRDLKDAMLGKRGAEVTVLRGLKSVILDAEVASGRREGGLPDVEIEKLIVKEVKKRKEAIAMYEAGGRGDLVESEKSELEILQRYLPKQLSEDEVREMVDGVLANIGEGEIVNMGKVIGEVKMLVGNGADGAMVAKIVKERIAA